MSSFELTRYVTIGQYIPADSAVHRLDPRVKIILFAMLVLTAAFASTYTGNVVMAAACLLVLIVSRVPVGYGLSGLRPALPFVVVLFILQVLFLGKGPGTVVLWQAGWFSVTADGLKIAVVAVMRFLEILCLVVQAPRVDTAHLSPAEVPWPFWPPSIRKRPGDGGSNEADEFPRGGSP
nr:energy-coupling factor transporter transmembrane component T [Kyrpidia tusciae]